MNASIVIPRLVIRVRIVLLAVIVGLSIAGCPQTATPYAEGYGQGQREAREDVESGWGCYSGEWDYEEVTESGAGFRDGYQAYCAEHGYGSDTGRGQAPIAPTSVDRPDLKLIEVLDSPDTDIGWGFLSAAGARVVILTEKDAYGDPTRPVGSGYISPEGEILVVRVDQDGFLQYVITNQYAARFSNYQLYQDTRRIVCDVEVKGPDGSLTSLRLLLLPDTWAQIMSVVDSFSLVDSFGTSKSRDSAAKMSDWLREKARWLKTGADLLGIGGQITGGMRTLSGNSGKMAEDALEITTGTTWSVVHEIADARDDSVMETLSQGLSDVMTLLSCVKGNVLNCGIFGLSIVSQSMDIVADVIDLFDTPEPVDVPLVQRRDEELALGDYDLDRYFAGFDDGYDQGYDDGWYWDYYDGAYDYEDDEYYDGHVEGYYYGYVDGGGYPDDYGIGNFGSDDGYYDGYVPGYSAGYNDTGADLILNIPRSGRRGTNTALRDAYWSGYGGGAADGFDDGRLQGMDDWLDDHAYLAPPRQPGGSGPGPGGYTDNSGSSAFGGAGGEYEGELDLSGNASGADFSGGYSGLDKRALWGEHHGPMFGGRDP